jgi:uncharacterized protein (DUF362 family)
MEKEKYYAYVGKIESNLSNSIKDSLDFINWKDYIKKDSVIFIKPNFTYPYYKKGITTSPNFLESLIKVLKNRSSKIIVGESNGGNHSFSADDSLRGHSMDIISKKYGIEIVNLSKVPSEFITEEIAGKRVKIEIPKLLLKKVDTFISVPVLKVHVMTGVTIGLKNLWGIYPDTMRCLHHKHLSYKLALFAKLINLKLVIVDGIYALDSHGPMYGEAKKKNLILASNNPVVSDTLGATIMGIQLKKARHILIAEKAGLGSTDLKKIKFNTDWTKYQMKFSSKKTFNDKISILPFHSDLLAKIMMDSSLSRMTYRIAQKTRNKDEKLVVNDLNKYH